MLSKVIVNYISQNKRLVVPNFGAFIRKDSGEVVFVEFLKKDDGVLLSLITQTYSVSPQESLAAVDNYVFEIRKSVGRDGQFAIPGLGFMYVNDNGLYDLKYDTSATAINNTAESQVAQTEPSTIAESNVADGEPIDLHIVMAEPQAEAEYEVGVASESTTSTEHQEIIGAGIGEKANDMIRVGDVVGETNNVVVLNDTAKVRTLNDLVAERLNVNHSVANGNQGNATATTPLAACANNKAEAKVEQDVVTQSTHNEEVNTSTADTAEIKVVKRKKSVDWIIIVAIVVAAFALLSILYGIFVSKSARINTEHDFQIENIEGEVNQNVMRHQ